MDSRAGMSLKCGRAAGEERGADRNLRSGLRDMIGDISMTNKHD